MANNKTQSESFIALLKYSKEHRNQGNNSELSERAAAVSNPLSGQRNDQSDGHRWYRKFGGTKQPQHRNSPSSLPSRRTFSVYGEGSSQNNDLPFSSHRSSAVFGGRPDQPADQEKTFREPERIAKQHIQPQEQEPEEEHREPVPYYAPPIADLIKPAAPSENEKKPDNERSQILQNLLISFGIEAQVREVVHMPSVTRFEIETAPGTGIRAFPGLDEDIAYGMSAREVRITAPIPGKNRIGIDFPEQTETIITLRELLESRQMQNARSILSAALGRDEAGEPVICDLERMPHILIGGQSGSGKTTCVHSIINSLLYRAGPDEVAMLMIDPDRVSLGCYDGIPHLLLPVISRPDYINAVLSWAVWKMNSRFEAFSERSARSVDSYNSMLRPGEKPMPRIVVFIENISGPVFTSDEKTVNDLSALIRAGSAAGIHFVLVSQNTRSNSGRLLNGLSLPCRIAFKTPGRSDSMAILSRAGAESLTGYGEMLYLPSDEIYPRKVYGCYISETEIRRVVSHVHAANVCIYDPDIPEQLDRIKRGESPETPVVPVQSNE